MKLSKLHNRLSSILHDSRTRLGGTFDETLSSVEPEPHRLSPNNTLTKFQDLSEDNIRSILSFCDIYAVVSMSATNRYFRQLALEKLVWVDLVENLRRKGFVDQLSLSNIQSHSQEALVALVKRLFTGPASWNPPIKAKGHWFRSNSSRQSRNPVEMSARYVVHPPGITYSKENPTKMLDGGEYVLFNNYTTTQCWNVHRDTLIWTYDKHDPESHVSQFAAGVVDGDGSANIIVCEWRWTPDGVPDQSYCILMNWKTNSQFTLAPDTSDSPYFVLPLVPNYLFILTNGASGEPCISIVKNTALSSHWRSIADPTTHDLVYPSQLEAIISESITFGNFGRRRPPLGRKLCVYESPLEEGTYRIWVGLSSGIFSWSTNSWSERGVICSYYLSLPTRDGDTTTLRTSTSASTNPTRNYGASPISYSGHTVGHASDGQHKIYGPSDSTMDLPVDFTRRSSYAHLSTYSGALVSLSNDNAIHTLYYK
ncbi:hypothetical protein B0H13DRAFT_1900621 [Mycena leptocephala]|nr:hypothetical protein B0H13DRAFT_1900621 [Mycena leptocephala]